MATVLLVAKLTLSISIDSKVAELRSKSWQLRAAHGYSNLCEAGESCSDFRRAYENRYVAALSEA
jgi:hypothetical protein